MCSPSSIATTRPRRSKRLARVLIAGGYGAFGSRVAERLACEPDLDLVIAGRSAERARQAAERIGCHARAKLSSSVLDAHALDGVALGQLAAHVIINASGPFQSQDYGLARAAIAAGANYLDLADARLFVAGFGCLDVLARQAGVLAVTGASTVPGLSAAVLDRFVAKFASIETVHYGICPGNSYHPGPATTASILSALGRPFKTLSGGQLKTVWGWQGLTRHRFPEIGPRWLGDCEIPDLDLFPQRYPTLQTVRFKAGAEVGSFHLALWALSWLCRFGLLRLPRRLVRPLLAIKHQLRFLGSDQGGMFVSLEGRGHDGARQRIDWHLVAKSGHGPFVPAVPAVLLAKKLIRGSAMPVGARPCLDLFTLDEFLAEIADLDITTSATIG
jgi:saccharopine dehydrogenase-like NADP-dependent oxidoreductase